MMKKYAEGIAINQMNRLIQIRLEFRYCRNLQHFHQGSVPIALSYTELRCL